MKADIIVGKTFDENLEWNGLEFRLNSKSQRKRPINLFYDIDQDKWSGTILNLAGSWSILNDDVVAKLVRQYALNYAVRENLRYKKWIEMKYEEALATKLFAEECQ